MKDPFEAMDERIKAYRDECILRERERIGEGFLLIFDKYKNLPPDLIGDIRKLIFTTNEKI